MKKLIVCIGAVAVAAALYAQTRITADQLSGPAVSVLVVTSSGRVAFAKLGTGLGIVEMPDGSTLISAVIMTEPPVTRRITGQPGRIAGRTVTFLSPIQLGTAAVYRNGLRQTSPQDYSVSGATITFAYDLGVGDTVVADFDTPNVAAVASVDRAR